ncbi:hypothetical protein DM01DRAFT_309847 [Hesseltinella vesiculosa]|uniref:PROP1-like PPR domain-containing protein n=1 Tax=Hesseltinella vesiculosa TaxID=101127 RepID=A0A1X2GD93_9FUNG|nr:hypothetical protein DM01DRAFT_309847 [Hesseltinella vesiculosa]
MLHCFQDLAHGRPASPVALCQRPSRLSYSTSALQAVTITTKPARSGLRPAIATGKPPLRLSGAFSLFNLTDRIALSDLDRALRLDQASRAWQLFCSLTSQPRPSSLPQAQPSSATITPSDNIREDIHHHMPVPFHHCTDLYSLLLYANHHSFAPNVIAMRQRQLDKLARYIDQQFNLNRHEWLACVTNRPAPLHKKWVQLLKPSAPANFSSRAWDLYLILVSKQGAHSIQRTHYLKLMAMISRDTTLPIDEREKRVAYIAQQQADITCAQGRRLSAAEIEWIGRIFIAYNHGMKKKGKRLVKEFIALSETLASKDAMDELVWRLIGLDFHMAHQAFEAAHAQGIAQNDALYRNLIQAYTERRRHGQALMVFEKMLTVAVTPSTRTFNAVLHVFADQGWTDRAAYLWETMRSLDLEPDAASYSEMIRCAGKAGDLTACMDYYQQMLHQQQDQQRQCLPLDTIVTPNVYTYSTLIEAYGQNNDMRGVLQWFHTLLRQGLAPNQIIMANVLTALSKHCYRSDSPSIQQLQLVDTIQRIAQQCIHAGVKTDVTLYTILLSVQATISSSLKPKDDNATLEQHLGFALQAHRDMLDQCVDPNAYTYTTLIDLCGHHGYIDTAEQLFDLMAASEHQQPTTATFCAMVDMWQRVDRQDKTQALLHTFLIQCKSIGLTNPQRLWIDQTLLQHFRCPHPC